MDTLSITNVRPVLEIIRVPAKLNIRTKRPVLKIKHSPAYMHVNRKAPSFKLNWLSVRSGIGLTSAIQMTRQFADESKQKVMQAIQNIVQKGDYMSHIEANNNPIAEIAEERLQSANADINIGLTLPQKEELEWDLGYFRIEWSRHLTQIQWEIDTKPEISIEPYSVEIKIQNQPVVKIKVNRNSIRNAVGSKVDKKI